MSATALLFALALQSAEVPATAVGDAPPPPAPGEPLPAGAPTDPYALTAWCYGALDEYLGVYERVTPDLRDIDKMFGSSVKNEKIPYAQDMAAARKELKVLAGAVTAAEKASPAAIAPQGVAAVKQGRAIWSPAEGKSHRELARAWLSWALPDRCDSNARELATKSALLGQALKYNAPTEPPAAEAAPPVDSPPKTPAEVSAPTPPPADLPEPPKPSDKPPS